jgi:hypothetical protein
LGDEHGARITMPNGATPQEAIERVGYIDENVVTSSFQGQTETVVNDPEFLGDSGIAADPGRYSFHPAPGVVGVEQVAFRPAK